MQDHVPLMLHAEIICQPRQLGPSEYHQTHSSHSLIRRIYYKLVEDISKALDPINHHYLPQSVTHIYWWGIREKQQRTFLQSTGKGATLTVEYICDCFRNMGVLQGCILATLLCVSLCSARHLSAEISSRIKRQADRGKYNLLSTQINKLTKVLL